MANANDVKRALVGDKNLREADLSGADLSGIDLTSANLDDADLTGANLTGAVLTSANFSRAEMSAVSLVGASMTLANLSGANLYHADLSDAVMSYSSLEGATIREADLPRASMRDARLIDADFSGSNMERVVMTGANASGADMSRTYLFRAKLSEADLERAQFDDSVMEGADLKRANLRKASLRGAILGTADLRYAITDGADFKGALLDGARFVSAEAKRIASQRKKSSIPKLLLGFVLNPKNGHIVAAVLDGVNVSAVDPRGSSVGEGYFDISTDMSTDLTGLTRAHTAQGVQQQTEGYGASLYTAINLCAHLFYSGVLTSDVTGKPAPGSIGDGISSYHCNNTWSRSPEAIAWWGNANTRHCMTKRMIAYPGDRDGVTSVTGTCYVDAYYYDRAKQLGLVLLEATEPVLVKTMKDPSSLVGKFSAPGSVSAGNIYKANWGAMATACGKEETRSMLKAFSSILVSQNMSSLASFKIAISKIASGMDSPPARIAATSECEDRLVKGFASAKKATAERKGVRADDSVSVDDIMRLIGA